MSSRRLVILTQNEPFFISRLIKKIVNNQSNDYVISKVYFLPQKRRNSSYIDWIKERLALFSFFELILLMYIIIYQKFAYYFHMGPDFFKIKTFLRGKKIEVSSSDDINSVDFLREIKELNPDLIVSISCPQILGKDLINSANKATINLHSTLLPRHRGVQGVWWTIFNNDAYSGVTVHYIDEGVDTGDMLLQKKFSLSKSYSQFRLAYLTKRLSFYCLKEVILSIDKLSVCSSKLCSSKGNYNYSPNLSEIKKYKSDGKRVIELSDLKYILSYNKSF